MEISDEREQRFKRVAASRQKSLTVILENVHDPHNIGAVLRSCDAVGIAEIFVIYTDDRLDIRNLTAGKASSSGARKWIKIHYFTDLEDCITKVRKDYKEIYASHIGKESSPIYSIDLTQSIAMAFGNEHDGISKDLLNIADGYFSIPMVGLVQSLNISVACAVSVYECFRQRSEAGFYHQKYNDLNPQHKQLFEQLVKRHFGDKYGLKLE